MPSTAIPTAKIIALPARSVRIRKIRGGARGSADLASMRPNSATRAAATVSRIKVRGCAQPTSGA